MNSNRIIRTTLRVPKDVIEKIKIFKNESCLTTLNNSIIKLIELGLIRYNEDNELEKYLVQILNQNNYIIKTIEDFINESKS